MEISDDEDEAMAWSPGRRHKVLKSACIHKLSSQTHVRQRIIMKAFGHQASDLPSRHDLGCHTASLHASAVHGGTWSTYRKIAFFVTSIWLLLI